MKVLFLGVAVAVVVDATAALAADAEKLAALQRGVRENPKSAEAHALLAVEYHWRKDFERAEGEYLMAGTLDSRYAWIVIPLWDEQKKWDAISDMVKRQQAVRSAFPASTLGPLATAYREKGDLPRARIVIAELERRRSEGEEEDCRNYVLAYIYLWDDKQDKDLARMKLVKSRERLMYAFTQEKFQKLRTHTEFVRLCESARQ